MRLDEVDVRIDYFHDASDAYLRSSASTARCCPSKDAWRAYYEEDFTRPLAKRETYNLAWELDGRFVGFSSIDHIELGEHAFMHLHIIEEPRRRSGLGTEFVRLSVDEYFRASRPSNASSASPTPSTSPPTAPSQRAGFRSGPCQRRSASTAHRL